MRRFLALVPLVLFASILTACESAAIALTPGESITTTCTGVSFTTDSTNVFVTCGGNLDAVYICPASAISATQLSPTQVRVGCAALEEPFWSASADTDTDLGDQTECMDKETPGLPFSRLSIVPDPQSLHSDVYQAELQPGDIAGGDDRAEWNEAYVDCDSGTEINLWGTASPPTTDIYIGWRSLFGGDITLSGGANEGNFAQWKGDSSCGGPAVGMTISNNRLTIRTIDGDYIAWVDTVLLEDRIDTWTDFVMRVNFAKESTGTGFIEFWVNGQPQTMSDDTLRFEGPTVCPNDARVYPKWGVYSMNSGAPIHWLEDPAFGPTYASVTP